MTVIPRRALYWTAVGTTTLATVLAVFDASFIHHVVAPFIAVASIVACGPSLLRGAWRGAMRSISAWGVALVAVAVPVLATAGIDPARSDSLSVGWYSTSVLAGAVLLWMARRVVCSVIVGAGLLVHTTLWAGPLGTLRLGIAAELLVLATAALMHRALVRVADATREAGARERDEMRRQVERDAFQLERQMRLHLAGRNAAPLLRHIIDTGGDLDAAARFECRVLEQTIRDEIRGRRLLNDGVREIVLAHRRRGAFVQMLDDGGLDDLSARELNPLLDELAARLAPVTSSRIVVRTAHADSPTAITVVATSPDETAVALGLDDDVMVDLAVAIPRAMVATPA